MFKNLNEIRNDESGFTMLNLLVGTVIFGVLSAIIIPGFIGWLTEGKNMSVQHNTIAAITAIEEYAGDNAGRLPRSLGDTKYKKFDDDAKVLSYAQGNDVCIVGWNVKGGDYTENNPYVLMNGVEVEKSEDGTAPKCDFSKATGTAFTYTVKVPTLKPLNS